MKCLRLLPLLASLAACGGSAPQPGPSSPAGKPAAAPEDDHGTPHPLGKLTVGGRTFDATLFGEVAAGAETALELSFAATETPPAACRAWLGSESGEGSRKARLGKEGDHGLHGHLVAPDPLPAGCRLWVEVEANGAVTRGSLALP